MFCCMCLLVETAQVYGDDTHAVDARPTMASEHGPRGGVVIFVGLVVEERGRIGHDLDISEGPPCGMARRVVEEGGPRPHPASDRKAPQRNWKEAVEPPAPRASTSHGKVQVSLPTRRTTKFPQKLVPKTRKLYSWIPTTTMAQWIRQERKHPTSKTEAASVEAAATTEATDAKKLPKSGTVSASGAAS